MNKIITLTGALFLFVLTAFTPARNIDNVINALRTGNSGVLGQYIEENVDIALPDKTESYSKAQAVMILKDFFSRNGVTGFEVKHKGNNSGNEFCIGMLQTRSGTYRTTVFMKAKGGRQIIKEIRFTSMKQNEG